jgi:hypothetical protein
MKNQQQSTVLTGRRKGAITEIDQVAGVVESSLHENEINNNQQASQYKYRKKGNKTINGRCLVGPHVAAWFISELRPYIVASHFTPADSLFALYLYNSTFAYN